MKKYFLLVLVFTLLAFGGMRTASAQLHPFNDADTRELQAFRLNDDIVERYRNATLALMEYAKAHPSKDDSDDEKDSKKGEPSISDLVSGMSKSPQLPSIMQSKGISPRQYVETMLVLVTGYSSASMKREGQQAAMKPSPIVSTVNMEYIKRNYDHLGTMRSSIAGTGDQ